MKVNSKIMTIVTHTIVPLIISIIVCIAYMFLNIRHETIRDGNEYCDSLLDGQVLCQQFDINNTGKIKISTLPSYIETNSETGIEYVLQTGEKKASGFVPLNSLPNHEWTTFSILTSNTFSGKATLTLKGVGMDQENNMQFLIVTNTLNGPDSSLTKNGEIIENGQITLSYISYNTDNLFIVFLIAFVVSFAICYTVTNKLFGIAKYPAVYATLLVFFVISLYYYPTLSHINLQVSTQYYFSYQNLGFVRRSLLGSIIEFLGIRLDVNRYIIWGIVLNALVSVCQLCFIYNKKNAEIKNRLEKCYFFFLCTPFCMTSLFGHHYFARLDQLLMIVFVISCLLIINNRGLILVPILSVIAILIHEMYLTTLFPCLFIILAVKWYTSRQKKDLALLITNSVVSVFLFLAISFVCKTSKTLEEAFAYTQVDSDAALSNWTYPMIVDFFSSSRYGVQESRNTIFQSNAIPLICIALVLLIPIIVIGVLWLIEYYKTKKDLLGKLITLLMPLTFGGIILSMATMCDWGRLFILYGFGVFYTVVSLMGIDSTSANVAFTTVVSSVKKIVGEKTIYVLGIFYLLISILDGGASSTTLFEFARRFFF